MNGWRPVRRPPSASTHIAPGPRNGARAQRRALAPRGTSSLAADSLDVTQLGSRLKKGCRTGLLQVEGEGQRHESTQASLLSAIAAVIVVLVGAPASAGAGEVDQVEVQIRPEGQELLITAESSASGEGCPSGQVCPSAVGSGSGWATLQKNVLSSTTDNKRVRAYYGETKRTSGTSCYKTSHHATLIKGTYGGEHKWFKDTGVKTNATANTGGSAWQNTSKGQKWTMAGAGYFDHACNGTWDFKTDNGQIDIVWTTP